MPAICGPGRSLGPDKVSSRKVVDIQSWLALACWKQTYVDMMSNRNKVISLIPYPCAVTVHWWNSHEVTPTMLAPLLVFAPLLCENHQPSFEIEPMGA
jgi:hypothetical protein